MYFATLAHQPPETISPCVCVCLCVCVGTSATLTLQHVCACVLPAFTMCLCVFVIAWVYLRHCFTNTHRTTNNTISLAPHHVSVVCYSAGVLETLTHPHTFNNKQLICSQCHHLSVCICVFVRVYSRLEHTHTHPTTNNTSVSSLHHVSVCVCVFVWVYSRH